ncbi:MAG TPA: SIR2 family protein, partial [Stellaceae bacterium]|nr:SIR2 family protein [Stellaceae bacterium]
PADLGTLMVDPLHEWAWSTGKNNFPQTYFEPEVDKSIFLKHIAAECLKTFGPLPTKHPLASEIDLLKKLSPHAIITTNFDTLIEELFPDFECVIGERIIPMSMSIIGELYKVHGTVNDPTSLVLTQEDYERFMRKRRYISSKMMTYFAEYPVFIMGYGLGDSNVTSIMSDLGEAMKDSGGLLDNVYYVEWVPDIFAQPHLKEEHVIAVEAGLPQLRVRTIMTSDFEWVFKALADVDAPVPITTKVLRHLAARVIELVRVDVPKNKVDIDYKKVENLTDNATELAMVLGISNVSNSNINFPYLLTQVSSKLGYSYWSYANDLLKIANQNLGFDIKAGDNEFHMAFKSGTKQITHKYSDKLVELLSDIKGKK